MTRVLTTFIDPTTGQEMELCTSDGDDSQDMRNNVRRISGHRLPPGFQVRPSSRPSIVRDDRHHGQGRPGPIRPRPASRGESEVPVQIGGEYLTIRKDAVVGLVQILGDVWAAHLGRPGMPEPTGDPATDFTNEALHRDALATHSQNRDRIRALTGLVERAAHALLS